MSLRPGLLIVLIAGCGACGEDARDTLVAETLEDVTRADEVVADVAISDQGALPTDEGQPEPDEITPHIELPAPPPVDTDGDGIADLIDNCPDVHNVTQANLDQDGLGDACDPDLDGDGWINDVDCAPHDPNINPSQPEWCSDGDIDANCDGMPSEEGAADCSLFYVDFDGDGSGKSSSARCLCAPEGEHIAIVGGDCADANPAFSALVAEACDDLDNNCSGQIDEGCDDDDDGYCDAAMVVVGSPAICALGGGDCSDYIASIHPGADDTPGDGLDADCDGLP